MKSKKPEYMTWDLERLQKEHFSLLMRYHASQVALHDIEYKEGKIERFLEALKDLTEDGDRG